jgi:hypothetical protein
MNGSLGLSGLWRCGRCRHRTISEAPGLVEGVLTLTPFENLRRAVQNVSGGSGDDHPLIAQAQVFNGRPHSGS